MRLGQYTTTNTEQPWYGARTDEQTVVNLAEAGAATGVDLPRRSTELLAGREWQRKAELALEHAEETGTGVYDLDGLDRHAPVGDPQKVVCVGLNYRDHAEEGDNPIPDEPVLFSKFPTTVTGPGSTISWDPDLTEKVDYEAELVAVIGKEARRVDEDEALEHVAGYVVGNDVSARDLQHGDGQWVRGKSLDGFAPIGPELVTADEVSDPHDLEIWAEVNGERLQESTTANLIFGIDELVSFCSQAFTLKPGDLIFTGTPPGVGVYREPPVLLEDGDEVTIGVDELGELTNTCSFDTQ
ncbi:fumarylacetoacetate hydrolase family protein [Natronorubrum daqingense]|uniref:2-keto-4-pentenoate hydratase/2-oxohepta-3-ene-1,7-dioic acid hydratase (Catechol pathway) n=1 Tax=Natronorubrum daqingense TaxID=588898 RepID=A0A1N7F1C1_9EURY|nr:fumarylacetoacetate hydrolase family protein [Natronorubrum daqingense]APX97464.1 5-carboxymethyl-2-hydroxymuconate isomerase [Natronorubrum daqingense]SIR94012.1 2-keto-4-pentenoate hydratase/2-oxohepta-3-ene-1,7-dioic acid hydratase (catechol pathway) [Natronorubrum daqingense]